MSADLLFMIFFALCSKSNVEPMKDQGRWAAIAASGGCTALSAMAAIEVQ